MIRELSYLTAIKGKTLSDIVNDFRLLCEKPPPKGFEKYYQPPGKKSADKKEENKDDSAPKKSAAPPPSSSSKDKSDWNLGMFGPTTNKGGGGGPGTGRPIGGDGGEKEKMMMYGALAGIGVILALAYFEMNYKEIAWKEFVNK